jgi:hypothetical protein
MGKSSRATDKHLDPSTDISLDPSEGPQCFRPINISCNDRLTHQENASSEKKSQLPTGKPCCGFIHICGDLWGLHSLDVIEL